MRDPDLWPEVLTRKMCLEWCDCEWSTMIRDMLKKRIKPAFRVGLERLIRFEMGRTMTPYAMSGPRHA